MDLSRCGLSRILQLLLLAPLTIVFVAAHLEQSQEAGAVIGPLLPPSLSLACPLCPYSALRAVRDVGCGMCVCLSLSSS